jgi:hypothetical protein
VHVRISKMYSTTHTSAAYEHCILSSLDVNVGGLIGFTYEHTGDKSTFQESQKSSTHSECCPRLAEPLTDCDDTPCQSDGSDPQGRSYLASEIHRGDIDQRISDEKDHSQDRVAAAHVGVEVISHSCNIDLT